MNTLLGDRADLPQLSRDMLDRYMPGLADQLLDLMPAPVYVCARNGVIVRYNRRAAEMWGRAPTPGDPAERFCGSYRLHSIDGAPLPHAECAMADVLRTGIPVRDREVVIERPDGTRSVALVCIDAIRDGDGNVTGALNCFVDITARKRAEEELRRSERDLEDFFENSVVGLHLAGPDGTILRANQAELDLLGYTREEYVGRNIAEFHADRAALEDILARLSRGEKLDSYPARLRAKDGSIRDVLLTSNARFDEGAFVHSRCFTLDVTGARRAEEALRESERRFRELLDGLPAAVYTTDSAGRITFYNRAAAELWGTRPELGRDEWCGSWRLYSPDGTPLPHDQCPMAIALREGRPVRGEETIAERPDGTRVAFMPYPTPLYDASGALAGAVNMLVDITERRAADRARAHLAAIVESSDDAVIGKTLDGIITSWNRGAELVFGYRADEVIGRPMADLFPTDRASEEDMILGQSRRGERVHHYETVRRHKDGRLIDVSVAVSPVRDANGRIVGASTIARDISAKKRDEKALRLSEERNRGLVEAIAAVVWTASGDGQVVDMSQWQALTGQSVAEMRGLGWLDAIHPDDRPVVREMWARAVRMRIPFDAEYRLRTASGAYRWYNARGVPLLAEDGRVSEWIGVCIDVTERKQAEDKTRLLAREVNHRANNLLTLMSAMMRQTRADTVPEFIAAMQGRIGALARVQTRLARDQWSRTDLLKLVGEELAPFGKDIEGRFRIAGPNVPLAAAAAQALAIIIHELATNAVKYGALSASEGQVAIEWTLTPDRQLVISWTESGGPRIAAPSRQGFGTRAISLLGQQLEGEVETTWDPDGFVCRLSVPASNLDDLGEAVAVS